MTATGTRLASVAALALGLATLMTFPAAAQDTDALSGNPDRCDPPPMKVSGSPDTASIHSASRLVEDCTGRWSEQQEEQFSVPESPAFTFLNTSPAEITRPSTWREFSVALLSGVNSEGKAQQGFALELAPFQVVPGFQVSLHDYQHNFFKRAAYRTQISLGTAQTSGDSGSTDIALGIRIPLFDDKDLVQSAAYMKDLGDSLLTCAPGGPGVDLAASRECLRRQKLAVDSAWNAFQEVQDRRNNWRGRRVIVAFAFGNRLVNSSFSDRQSLGWSAWAVASNPLGHWGLLVGRVAYTRRLDVPDSPAFSSLRYGARAIVGSTGVNAFLEVVGEDRFDRAAGVDPGQTSWSAGLEVRLVHGMWLSTGFGQRYAEAQSPDRVVVLANIRWGLSDKPRGLDLATR